MENLKSYRLSEDKTYWIGTTNNGDEFWFDGSLETIEYVKSCNWRKRTDGYFQNYQGERLHRVIMNVTDSSILVDHKNSERWDNRQCVLKVSDYKNNNKNKKPSGKTGVTGLTERNGRCYGSIRIDGKSYRTVTKDRDSAYIDLLIVQREYKFLHNEKDFYLLDNISEEIITNVLNLIKGKINRDNNTFIKSNIKNLYELSEDGSYYTVYTNNKIDNINTFTISVESKCLIDKWCWSLYKNKAGKYYIHANVENGKTSLIHRYILGLNNGTYSKYFVDHINGNGLDNTIDNLVITDVSGNNSNINGKGYYMTKNNKYRAAIGVGEYNTKISKYFDTEEEASIWYKEQKFIQLAKRNIWKTKEELDAYLNNINKN